MNPKGEILYFDGTYVVSSYIEKEMSIPWFLIIFQYLNFISYIKIHQHGPKIFFMFKKLRSMGVLRRCFYNVCPFCAIAQRVKHEACSFA